jgi:hypothetical protein
VFALFAHWNWTEVGEGTFVSLLFVLIPVIAHHELRHKKQMRSHRELDRKLDSLKGEE